MLAYYRDRAATEAAASDGLLRTGDLGVIEPDVYIRLTDRSKDVMISGGENISSVEVEQMLEPSRRSRSCGRSGAGCRVGRKSIAFVALRASSAADEAALFAYARAKIARLKIPKHFVFGQLPKAGTGKIQKFGLRERARLLVTSSAER